MEMVVLHYCLERALKGRLCTCLALALLVPNTLVPCWFDFVIADPEGIQSKLLTRRDNHCVGT